MSHVERGEHRPSIRYNIYTTRYEPIVGMNDVRKCVALDAKMQLWLDLADHSTNVCMNGNKALWLSQSQQQLEAQQLLPGTK